MSNQHHLKIEGTGPATLGRCSCGDCYLVTYVTTSRRENIREQHAQHIKNVEWAARLDAGAAS